MTHDQQDALNLTKELFTNIPVSTNEDYVSKATVADIIRLGRTDEFKEILPVLDLSSCVLDHTPTLHFAIRENQVEILHLLLEHGADINQTDDEGRSPLHVAISNNRRHICEMFVGARCNIEIQDNFGQFPLHIAIDNEHLEICNLLIAHNCNINSQNMYGKTALHLSIKQQNTLIINLLLEHGANCGITDNNGQSPAHIAAKSNNLQVLKLLSTKVETDLNCKDKLGRTALMWGINNMNIAMLKFLCDVGVDMTVQNYFGETPFYTACFLYCYNIRNRPFLKDIILLILEHSTTLDIPNRKKVTPVQLFVQANLLDMAQLLLLNGADVNQTDAKGRSLLYNAVAQSDQEMLELLLNFSPDINVRDGPAQNSLLHLAAHNGDLEIMELLLENGINCGARNEDGQTAVHLALASQRVDALKLLIRYGADVNKQDARGNTPLHYLVSRSTAFSGILNMRGATAF